MARTMLARLAAQQARQPSERTRYDPTRSILTVRRNGRWVAALDTSDPPKTKKGDIEKGEDQKDRWG